MSRIDNGPNDPVRRGRQNCMNCGTPSNLATVPFRGRYITLCAGCRVKWDVAEP